MGSLSTDLLTRLHDGFELAGPILAILIGVALFGQWLTGRELSHRQTAESAKVGRQLAAAERDAAQLRHRLAPREVSLEQRRRLLAALGGLTGNVHVLYGADPETERFGRRVGAVLAEADW